MVVVLELYIYIDKVGRTDRIVLIYIGIVFFLKGFVFFWLRIVLKGMKFVFFLNMDEEGSFTNILDGK